MFRLTCGFIHISLSDSAHSPADWPCWWFILKSSPHMTAKETKRFIFPLILRGFLLEEKRILMSSRRMGLKHTILKKFWKSEAEGVRWSLWKGKVHSLGFLIAPQGCLRTRTFQDFPLISPTPLCCHLLYRCLYVGQNHSRSIIASFFWQPAGLMVLRTWKGLQRTKCQKILHKSKVKIINRVYCW